MNKNGLPMLVMSNIDAEYPNENAFDMNIQYVSSINKSIASRMLDVYISS